MQLQIRSTINIKEPSKVNIRLGYKKKKPSNSEYPNKHFLIHYLKDRDNMAPYQARQERRTQPNLVGINQSKTDIA